MGGEAGGISGTLLWIILIVGLMGFMFWSQWRARKRMQQQINELAEGQRVVTIGGIYGKLTRVDREGGMARLEIAPGVEIEIALRAISHAVDTGAAE